MNCLDLCIYMDNSLVVFFDKFSFTSSFFFVKNAKNNVSEGNGFGVKCFIKSKYRRIQAGLAIVKTSNI